MRLGTQVLPLSTASNSAFFVQLEYFRRRELLRARHSIVRAATLNCSRNHACAGSASNRGCHVMKYGNGLISLGGSTKRTPLRGRTIVVSIRGKVSTRSVFATENIAAEKNGTVRTIRRFAPR